MLSVTAISDRHPCSDSVEYFSALALARRVDVMLLDGAWPSGSVARPGVRTLAMQTRLNDYLREGTCCSRATVHVRLRHDVDNTRHHNAMWWPMAMRNVIVEAVVLRSSALHQLRELAGFLISAVSYRPGRAAIAGSLGFLFRRFLISPRSL